jgi:hypothetical protein
MCRFGKRLVEQILNIQLEADPIRLGVKIGELLRNGPFPPLFPIVQFSDCRQIPDELERVQKRLPRMMSEHITKFVISWAECPAGEAKPGFSRKRLSIGGILKAQNFFS